MATEFLIPSDDMTITDKRREELIRQFYDTFLSIMDEFHGINQVFHPETEAAEYTNNGKQVFESLLTYQVDDMLNMFDAGFKGLTGDQNTDAIYLIAMRKFHPNF